MRSAKWPNKHAHIADVRYWAYAHKKETKEQRCLDSKFSEEAVLQGQTRGRGPRAHPQLAVDGVEVPLDCSGAQEEFLGDLWVGEPFGYEPQYLYLPRCELGRVLARGGG